MVKSANFGVRSQKGKRVLRERMPKILENTKKCIYMRAGKTSDNVMNLFKDIASIKKPNGLMLGRKNDVHPFDDDTLLEKLCRQNDCSLFAVASHSKKRPNNLVLGRMFDSHLLDMVEFGVGDDLRSMTASKTTVPMGCKPVLLFAGAQFDANNDWRRIRSLLTDFFKGETVTQIRPRGCEVVIAFVATGETTIKMCTYRSISTAEAPLSPVNCSLTAIGPSVTLTVRRHKLAADDLAKQANRQPRTAKPIKTKNVSKDVFGSTVARVHVGKQNINDIQTRKHKALRKRNVAVEEEADEGEEQNNEEGDEPEMEFEEGVVEVE